MSKLKITIIFGNTPNFDENAFKYFILSINKIQSIYEFTFPDIYSYPFLNDICEFKTSNNILEEFISKNEIIKR